MGGRGSASMKSKSSSGKKYVNQYRGQVSRTTAGLIYKYSKSGQLKILPETSRYVYNMADLPFKFRNDRYNSDSRSYDLLDKATEHLINNDIKKANKVMKEFEDIQIRTAAKRSPYYKYSSKKY